MPYLHISVARELTPEQKETIKSSAGKLIEILPTKTEKGLMIRIDDSQQMYFRGVEANCAHVNVCLYLMSPNEKKGEFARAFAVALADILGTDPTNIYLCFTEYGNWYVGGVFR